MKISEFETEIKTAAKQYSGLVSIVKDYKDEKAEKFIEIMNSPQSKELFQWFMQQTWHRARLNVNGIFKIGSFGEYLEKYGPFK